jgi:RAB protein geranylgeranyltransferase component A
MQSLLHDFKEAHLIFIYSTGLVSYHRSVYFNLFIQSSHVACTYFYSAYMLQYFPMVQGFARFSVVYGSIYMLNKPECNITCNIHS